MSRRRKRPLKSPATTFIENMSHDGRGIARIDGKTTFIQGALLGETVTFQYLQHKKNFDEGKVLSVDEPSSNRVEPGCAHYAMCGGCSLQHMDASVQIEDKQTHLLDLLSRTGNTAPETIIEPLTSGSWHYRNKARLSVRYVEKKKATLVGFREKNNPRFIADITNCAILNAKVDAELVHLRQLIDAFTNPAIIAQIEVAAGDDTVALIFRNLSPLTQSDEDHLKLFADKTGFKIYLQPEGEASVALFYPKSDSELLSYHLPTEQITFQFHPTDFTQVNAGLNRLMVPRALDLLALKPDDRVLDLFCGLGNFTLPIARHALHVVGVEGSERMVERATMNAKRNLIDNTTFVAANLDDEQSLALLSGYQCNKVLLDPPRTGALAIVNQMDKLQPSRIVYVSCNPATLARDADILVNQHGYTLVSAGVMDMFPHTSHVESIALFEK